MNKLVKERRELFLEKLITEGVANVLAEQDAVQQQQQISTTPPANQGPSPETNAMDPDAQGNPGAKQNSQQKEVFDVDEMVDRLNILRGSRSFTDPEVYGRLTTFFNNLTDEQKNSIDWLLTELGKVVIDAREEQVNADQQQPPAQQPTQAQKPQQPAQQNQAAPTMPAAPVSPSNI